MVPAVVGFLLWPRQKKHEEEWKGEIRSHQLAKSSSGETCSNSVKPRKSKIQLRKSTTSRKTKSETEVRLGCHLCGQTVPRSTLLTHITECMTSWNRREEIKPADERVPLPTYPTELDQSLPEDLEGADKFNKHMRSIWLKAINRRCEHCRQTLKAGAYFRHIKACAEKQQRREEATKAKHVKRRSSTRSIGSQRSSGMETEEKMTHSGLESETPTSKKSSRSLMPRLRKKSLFDGSKDASRLVPENLSEAEEKLSDFRTASETLPRQKNPRKNILRSRRKTLLELSKESAVLKRAAESSVSKRVNVAQPIIDLKRHSASVSRRNVAEPVDLKRNSVTESVVQKRIAGAEKENPVLSKKTERSKSNKGAPKPPNRFRKSIHERKDEPKLPKRSSGSFTRKPDWDSDGSSSVRTLRSQSFSGNRIKDTEASKSISTQPTIPEKRPKTSAKPPVLERTSTKARGNPVITVPEETKIKASISTETKPRAIVHVEATPKVVVSTETNPNQAVPISERRKALAALESSVERFKTRQESSKKAQTSRMTDASSVASSGRSYQSERNGSSIRRQKKAADEAAAEEEFKNDLRLLRHWSVTEKKTTQDGSHSDRGVRRSLDTAMSFSFRQRGYTCYLCGRQFGSASLLIHLRQCRQLWKDRESLKRRSERRPLPTPPPEVEKPLPTDPEERQAFNDAMTAIWGTKALIPCIFCGRTFTNEAYEKHRRICTEETPGGPLGMSKYRRPSTENEPLKSHRSVELAESSSGPLQYCCYLCGRHYGSHSLLLHVPRCKKLWEDREAVKSKKECRSVPPPPPEYEGFPNLALPTDPDEVLAFNNAVYSYWDRVSLLVCSICGRSFNEDSFEKHQRLCSGSDSARKTSTEGSQKAIATTATAQDNLKPPVPKHYVCYLCGRQYGSKSLMIHIPSCEKQWVADEQSIGGWGRPLPPRPHQIQSSSLPTTPEDIETFNTEMLIYWEKNTLLECASCGRTFNSDAIVKHQKHCSGKKVHP